MRTSHYPPVKEYLELADQFGVYIVDETGDESHATEYISGMEEWRNELFHCHTATPSHCLTKFLYWTRTANGAAP